MYSTNPSKPVLAFFGCSMVLCIFVCTTNSCGKSSINTAKIGICNTHWGRHIQYAILKKCLQHVQNTISWWLSGHNKGPTNEMRNLRPCSLCAALRWHFLKIKDELVWNFDSWQFPNTPIWIRATAGTKSIKLCISQLDLMMVQQAFEMDSAGPTSHMELNAKSAMVLKKFECWIGSVQTSSNLVWKNGFPGRHAESSALCDIWFLLQRLQRRQCAVGCYATLLCPSNSPEGFLIWHDNIIQHYHLHPCKEHPYLGKAVEAVSQSWHF